MRKALIVSSVIGFLVNFEQGDIEELQNLGYEVHCATNFNTPVDPVKKKNFDKLNTINHQIDFERNPLSLQNYTAYKQIRKLGQQYKFSLIHCHTPIGGVVGRLAAKSAHIPEVIYTAHGFHFYERAPIKNWIIYYSIEKCLSKITTKLITINDYDYNIASRKFKAKKTFRIHGVGIDLERFNSTCVDRKEARRKLGIKDDNILLLTVGELTEDKNTDCFIRIAERLFRENKCYKAMIAGEGPLMDTLKKRINNKGLDDVISLLGYRTDILDLLSACDMFVFTSKFEGLPVALMEAIAMKKIIVCSRVRGNTDLIKNESELFEYDNDIEAVEMIKNLGNINLNDVIAENYRNLQAYGIESVRNEMRTVYTQA